MRLMIGVGVLVLTLGLFTFSEGVNYDDPNIYKVKIVDNVYYKRPEGEITFEIDERQIDISNLPDGVRMNMCRIAEKVMAKEKFSVTFTNNTPGRKHAYTLRTGDSDTVLFVDAFRCPTKPAMYLQVILNEDDEENVIIIVQSKRKRTINIALESVQYKLKVVADITEASENEIASYTIEDDAVDEDALRDEELLQMCEDAIRKFPEEGIRHSKSRKIKGIKFYGLDLDLEGGKRNGDFEVVQAFRCPTSPPTYVTVPKKFGENFEAYLIIEELERTDRSIPSKETSMSPKSSRTKEIVYEYKLKPVMNIIDVTTGSPGEARIANVIRSAINSNGSQDEKCQEMCRHAFRKVERDYRFVRYFPEEKIELNKYYAIHSNIGDRTVNIEILEAFKCSIQPATYIHVPEKKRDEVWVIIKDKRIDPTFENALFNIQTVKNIEKASTRDIVRKLSNSRERLTMDTDDLTEDERHEMCRKATENISGKEVKYLDVHPGMSKLYSAKLKGSKKKKKKADSASDRKSEEKEKADDDSDTETELLRAFECPTNPKLHLEVVLDWDSERCIVRILIKESDLEAQCDDTCYQIKLVNKITERSKYKGSAVFNVPQTETVDTDKLDEDKRMEMCRKAIKINALKDTSFTFSPKTKTGKKNLYVLELKGAGRRDTPELVKAFKCPTKPLLHLHVVKADDDDKKEIVWVIFNDDAPDEVKFVGDDNDPRFAFCKKALETSPAEGGQEGGQESKYYLFGMRITGSGKDKVSGKDVMKRFICPTRPPLKLEVHPNDEDEDEDDDDDDNDDDYVPIARPAWRPRGLPGPKFRGIYYKKKYVDRITKGGG